MNPFYKNIYFYCNADENGNILDAIAGYAIVPDEQRQYFFILDSWEVVENQDKYRIVDNGLGTEKKIVLK